MGEAWRGGYEKLIRMISLERVFAGVWPFAGLR